MLLVGNGCSHVPDIVGDRGTQFDGGARMRTNIRKVLCDEYRRYNRAKVAKETSGYSCYLATLYGAELKVRCFIFACIRCS